MRVPTIALSRPYVYPLIASIVALLGFYCLRVSDLAFQNVETLLAGVATATFASYITIILVDRNFRDQEEKRRQKMQNTALRQLRTDVNTHLTFLSNMYIAASEEYPNSPPSTYEELFNDDFSTTIQLLDFSKEYPTAGESRVIRWFDYSESNLKEFQNSIDQVITQYSAWLDPEIVEKVHNLKSSRFMTVIISASEVDLIQLDREMGFDREYAILIGEDNIIQEHTDLLLELIQEYQEVDDIELTNVEDLNAWSENVTPHPESARLPVESLINENEDE